MTVYHGNHVLRMQLCFRYILGFLFSIPLRCALESGIKMLILQIQLVRSLQSLRNHTLPLFFEGVSFIIFILIYHICFLLFHIHDHALQLCHSIISILNPSVGLGSVVQEPWDCDKYSEKFNCTSLCGHVRSCKTIEIWLVASSARILHRAKTD